MPGEMDLVKLTQLLNLVKDLGASVEVDEEDVKSYMVKPGSTEFYFPRVTKPGFYTGDPIVFRRMLGIKGY